MAKTTFTGGKELEAALLQLTVKVAKKLARQALRKAAKPIFDAAKANVPVDKGDLRRAISTKVDQKYNRQSRRRLPEMQAVIAVAGRGAKITRDPKQSSTQPRVYGTFVEFGTADTRAQPFIRPAWDSEGGERALERIGKEMGAAIEREAAKGGR